MKTNLKEWLMPAGLAFILCGMTMGFCYFFYKPNKHTLIKGIPITVSSNDRSVSTIIEKNGTKILAYSDDLPGLVPHSFKLYSKAACLINNEIEDDDKEPIILFGDYDKDNCFRIDYIKTNTGNVDFTDEKYLEQIYIQKRKLK